MANTLLDPQSVWNKCLAFIKDNVNAKTYDMWFKPIQAVSLNDNKLVVGVPGYVYYEWLEKNA